MLGLGFASESVNLGDDGLYFTDSNSFLKAVMKLCRMYRGGMVYVR